MKITIHGLNFPWYRHWHLSMCKIYELSKHCNDQRDIIKCSLRQLSIASFLRSNCCSVPDIYSIIYLFYSTKFFKRSDIWLNTFQGRTNHQTLSKAEHATKSIHRPHALSKSLSERAPRHDQIFFRTNARPNYVFLQPSTQDQLFYYLFFYYYFFFTSKHFLRSSTWQKKKNSQFEHTTKNPQKPKYYSGSIHDQTFPQVDHTNKNLLRGTNNSKMLLGGNTAGRETHEPTTRKTCATNKLKISGNRGPNGIKALRLWLTCLEF